jgi:hypothetical protein
MVDETNRLDYRSPSQPAHRSRRRWIYAVLFGCTAGLFLLAVVLIAWVAGNVSQALNNPALRTIADNGAAAMKSPMGRVFVADGKRFGDRQLLAILPALPQVDNFNSLDLHGSSVTDAAVAQLKTLEELRSLDVSDTPVTVNGLLALQRLPKLGSITVSPGQLSESDMQRLNAAFPRVIKSFRGDQHALVRTTGPPN